MSMTAHLLKEEYAGCIRGGILFDSVHLLIKFYVTGTNDRNARGTETNHAPIKQCHRMCIDDLV